MNNDYLKLCLVTELTSYTIEAYKIFIEKCIRGGVTCVQLRDKNLSLSELKSVALSLQTILKSYQVPLIINDHASLVKEVKAAGVHLGQSDLSPQEARHLLGPDAIIGLSIESLEELAAANQLESINYVAASAIYPSQTKLNCKTYWGLAGLKQVTQLSRHPVVAIGGIETSKIDDIMEQGAAGVAIVSALHQHPDPELLSKIFIEKINKKLSARNTHD